MGAHSNLTQNQRLLDYLASHGSVTQIEALNKLGIMRLASRVSDLRKKGYQIDSKMDMVTNRYGEKCRIKRYSLRKERIDG